MNAWPRDLTTAGMEATFFILREGTEEQIAGWLLLNGGCPEQSFIDNVVRGSMFELWPCRYGHVHRIPR